MSQKKRLLNNIGNLMLVCHDCHRKIDKELDGGRYTVELLTKWKHHHEKRIAIVTGVAPTKKSTVVLYGANIGDELSPLQAQEAHLAMFPHSCPSEELPLRLNMKWEGKDNDPQYWMTEEQNLRRGFERLIYPRISEGDNFSIFGLAPIPLLIRLGTLMTDKIPAQVYQLHREPDQTWLWSKKSHDTNYLLKSPASFEDPPALIISLSSHIAPQRVTSILGEHVAIWELTIEEPHNDFLQCRMQLSGFREAARRMIAKIAKQHGQNTPLAIFPAMPVATAIELGRVRMPKADMPWIIYDHNNKTGAFAMALKISGGVYE
ncbi:SAVED domain-containing protein [Nitrospira japonica]|uniref:SAVED domain-containing protein n=1 Tax=Nitrospira japonica TaxID=1325564 RepID=UPI0018D3B0DC|nr:SAVED domain-containing protein [Nitrospira japonica]